MANALSWINATPVIPVPNIGWWKFNEGLGINAADSSAAGNTGTLLNTPTWIVNGSGFALTFASASTQAVSTTNTVNIANVTISAWLNVTGYPLSKQNVVGFCNGLNNGTADKILSILPAGQIQFYVFDGAGKSTTWTGGSPIGISGWHHIAGTCDSANALVYLDGVQVGNVALAGGSFTGYTVADIFIAAACAASSWGYLDGSVDDVRIWSSALSANQIATLNAGGIA